MDELEREVCFNCGEATPLDARVCRFCQASLLVTVVVERAVADTRARYQAARAVAVLGPLVPRAVPVQQALAQVGAVVARGVTRGQAWKINDAVVAAGGLTRVETAPARSLPPWVIAASVAAAAVVIAGAVVITSLRRGNPDVPSASPAVVSLAPEPGGEPPAAANLSLKQLAERGMPSTVALRCRNSVASGFFVAQDLVLTNAHALCPGGEAMEVSFSDGHKVVALSSRSDPKFDLAVIRVPSATTPALPLGDVGTVSVGDKVAFIGSPMGLDFTVHEGSVSSLTRSVRGTALIQLDAKVNPGNSGGPLLDGAGRVIGIVTMKHSAAEGIGLALPINYAYTGPDAIVGAPDESAGSEAFDAMVARAGLEGVEDDVRVAESSGALGLVGAEVDRYRNLVVHVLKPASAPPAFALITITVWRGSDQICTLKNDITEWHSITEGAAAAEVERALRPWAEKRMAASQGAYVGKTSLPWLTCGTERLRPGIVIELADADPEAAKLVLR